MNVRAMKSKILIRSRKEVPNGRGGCEYTWEDLCEIWAEVKTKPITRSGANDESYYTEYDFTTRYNSKLKIGQPYKALYCEKELSIPPNGVQRGATNREMKIRAYEHQG